MQCFPYKYTQYAPEDIHQMYAKLRAHDYRQRWTVLAQPVKIYNLPDVVLYYEQQVVQLTSRPEDYTDFNILSDMFQEDARIRARINNQPSPWDYFMSNKRRLFAKFRNDKHAMREYIYQHCREATSFRPTIMKTFIDLFRARRILDPCAGWGDRLLGAAAAKNVEYYHGYDCNPHLQKGYQRMRNFLKIDNERFQVHNQAFEDAQLTAQYDLVLTCPPYFTFEHYCNDSRQAPTRYTTEDEFVQSFLLPMFRKAWAALVPGGHWVLVLNQTSPQQTYMLQLASALKDYNFRGGLTFGEDNPQPIWIWQKL